MSYNKIIWIFLLTFYSGCDIWASSSAIYNKQTGDDLNQDTLLGNQILYNGRFWRNIYYKIKDDQFLFSSEMMPGSVSVSGHAFDDLLILYDIYNDEIIIPNNSGYKLQLNKEMVDSFSLNFENNTYRFINIGTDTLRGFRGYVNILVEGNASLYVKYRKKIDPLAYEGTFDMFSQYHNIYVVINGIIQRINRKRELYNLFGNGKGQARSFVKKSKLYVSLKFPESIIPVIKYYNSLGQ